MTHRSEPLQSFVNAASAAFSQFARGPQAHQTVQRVFAALRGVRGTDGPGTGSRLPVCSHLAEVLAVETPHESLRKLCEQFKSVEPLLQWGRRPTYDKSASENFEQGHANAMIIGPSGLEDRNDVWLGVSLMAPNVRYPDHNHGPEEVYLVLSGEAEFRQGEGAWFSPGIGGSFYNRPQITHAMRSGGRPLFAFWVLRVELPK